MWYGGGVGRGSCPYPLFFYPKFQTTYRAKLQSAELSRRDAVVVLQTLSFALRTSATGDTLCCRQVDFDASDTDERCRAQSGYWGDFSPTTTRTKVSYRCSHLHALLPKVSAATISYRNSLVNSRSSRGVSSKCCRNLLPQLMHSRWFRRPENFGTGFVRWWIW